MLLFERNIEVDRLASVLDGTRQPQRTLETLVTVAWYLRQRDNGRACAFAATARTLLAGQTTLSAKAAQQLQARLGLVDAETHWLMSDFEQARHAARSAIATFTACDDLIGCADAHGILASVHASTGELLQRDQCLAAAAEHAARGDDALRVDYFEANRARYAVLRDVHQSNLVWGQRFADDTSSLHPGVAASLHSYFATRDYSSGNFASAAVQFDKAFEAATQSGQVLVSVLAAVNAGNTYSALNDHDAALECLQRGLDLARPTGWAIALGPCLHQMAEILVAMDRLDAAQSMLDEAMQVYNYLASSDSMLTMQTQLPSRSMRQSASAAWKFATSFAPAPTAKSSTFLSTSGSALVNKTLPEKSQSGCPNQTPKRQLSAMRSHASSKSNPP